MRRVQQPADLRQLASRVRAVHFPRSARASIWTDTTANCAVRSHRSLSSQPTPRCGGASTSSSAPPSPQCRTAATHLSPPPAAVKGWNSKKEIFIMSRLWLFESIAFSFIAWAIVTAQYIWPELRFRQRTEALRPVLILHSFRFVGLAFLVPGVVSPDLPSAYAHSAAYGDIIAAILALLALISLPSASGVVIAWIFSLWGTADLFNAFYQANHAGLMAGQLGATYFIPTLIVPLLMITHVVAFYLLLRPQPKTARAFGEAATS